MRVSWLVVPLWLGTACGSDDQNRPPEFVPDATTSAPRRCEEVRAGQVVNGAVWYDGEPAACGADGMQCPVFDVAAFAGVCKVGAPNAICQNGRWVVSCHLDAGLADAASGDAAGE